MAKSKLTPKQRMFVDAYAGNATQAAIAAGYTPRSAYNAGARLMKNDEVLALIKKREQRVALGHRMRLEEAQEVLTEMARDAVKPEVRLKAIGELGKVSGWHRHKLEVTGELGILDLVRESYTKVPTPNDGSTPGAGGEVRSPTQQGQGEAPPVPGQSEGES